MRITRKSKSWAGLAFLFAAVSALWLILASGQNGETSNNRPNKHITAFAGESPWASAAACEKALHSKKSRTKPGRATIERVRIGSWNLQWFPGGASDGRTQSGGTNVEWLACTIAWMDLQLLSVQEVKQTLKGRRAVQDLLDRLDEYTGGRWQARFDDCPDDGRQHVGLLFNTKRVTVSALRTIASLNPTGSRCGGRLRPGYAAYLRFNRGADLHLVNLHFDSGISSRDYRNRVASWQSLRTLIRDRNRVVQDDDIIVMGDFNTMGCTKCREPISAKEEIDRLVQLLHEAPESIRRLEPNRNCTAHYRGRGSILDHVFVASDMKEAPPETTAQVSGLCRETSCFQNKRFPRTALTRLSDHCPIVVELLDRDLD